MVALYCVLNAVKLSPKDSASMAVTMFVATLIPDSESTFSLQGHFESATKNNQHQLLLSHCLHKNVCCLFKKMFLIMICTNLMVTVVFSKHCRIP